VTTIYDISPLVSPRIAVFPGDTPLSRQVLLDIEQGANITLSSLTATVHLGAHADAPNHYGRNAASIEARSLEPYLGRCQVVSAQVGRGERVSIAMLSAPIRAPRVLIRTGTFPNPDRWNSDFAALDPALIDACAKQGVQLIGIDTPSVDSEDSKELPSHARLLAHDLAVLEGLVLDAVADGEYELIALPLRLEGFDASPVRAVLRSLP
jgi:arylformamidase